MLSGGVGIRWGGVVETVVQSEGGGCCWCSRHPKLALLRIGGVREVWRLLLCNFTAYAVRCLYFFLLDFLSLIHMSMPMRRVEDHCQDSFSLAYIMRCIAFVLLRSLSFCFSASILVQFGVLSGASFNAF